MPKAKDSPEDQRQTPPAESAQGQDSGMSLPGLEQTVDTPHQEGAAHAEGDVTLLLKAYSHGDEHALRDLINRVYSELRRMAAGQLQLESSNPLMEPTALANEAYLRMMGRDDRMTWANRRHFFAAASETMRRILVDQARMRLAKKRGGGATQVPLDDVEWVVEVPDDQILNIDAALKALTDADPKIAELVKLRFFACLSENEVAETLGISRATASRKWKFAKTWLYDWLKRGGPDGEPAPRHGKP